MKQPELARRVRGDGECRPKRTAVGDQVVKVELVFGAEIQEHRESEIGDVLLRGRVVSLSQEVEG